ncbi:hypothetical protein B6U96_15890 [Archaeoglobales archaeon ex4484_92]|nr:MAG: hypothetical protein B6U96_15890 [Archaeoglobales archaeon ex4484_92]
MINLGLYLTVLGMGGVFLALSLLAIVMWILGRIFSPKPNFEIEEIEAEGTFTNEELMAAIVAIMQFESLKVPKIKVSEKWKDFARYL